MRDIFNKVATFAKNHPVIIGASVLSVVIPFAVSARGPNRAAFTMEQPANYVTFNSITNNPVIGGDERNFVTVREKGSANVWHDSLKVQEGKEYLVRMYVHNNAHPKLNLVAENVVAKMNVPTANGKKAKIDGLIASSNAKPNQVWDEAYLTADEDFRLEYVSGSAKFENNGFKGGVQLPDSLVTNSGAKLGYDKFDGKIPGCMQYAGYVTILVRPQFAKKPVQPAPKTDLTVNKTVRKIGGEKAWIETVLAQDGETVQFQIEAKNTGNANIDNMIIRDTLPKGLEYIKGSSKIYKGSNQFKGEAINDSVISDAGFNAGSYAPGANVIIRFNAKVIESQLPVCGENTITNIAQASDGKTIAKSDNASVKSNKKCKSTPPPVTPPKPEPKPEPKPQPQPEPKKSFACESITIRRISTSKIEVSSNIKEENMQITGVKYVVRNEKREVILEKIVNRNTTLTISLEGHYGKFSVQAYAMNGTQISTSENCLKFFEIEKPAQEITKIVECTSLVVSQITRTRFVFEIGYKVVNEGFGGVQYIIRDSNNNVIISKIIRNETKFEYNFTQTGNFTIVAIILNGNSQPTQATCKKEIEVKKAENPAISITKTVNGQKSLSVLENQEFNYEITVKNTGNKDLSDVKVNDKAPAYVKFLSADSGNLKDNNFTAIVKTLKVGEKVTFKIKSIATISGVTTRNIACVDTPTIPGNNDGCDSAIIMVPPKKINIPTPKPNPIPEPTPEPTPEVPAVEIPSKEIPHNPAPIKNTPNMPAELPKTGLDIFGAVLGLGSLTTAFAAYFASRRKF